MDGEPGWDEVIARLAGSQHGVVARRQLAALGVPRGVIESRIRRRWLRRLHQGVYAVGHDAVSREGRWIAAVLAAGDGAVLSHGSAAALWGIAPERGAIEVSVAGARRGGGGYVTHRSPVAKNEKTRRHGIPATTVDRTILDLAATLGHDRLERIIREADLVHPGTTAALARLLRRHPRRPGTNAIRATLCDVPTRSQLESAFRRFLKRHRIPLPDATNVRLPWGEVDCAWYTAKLGVELDSFGVHKSRSAFERDRARDREALLAGWRIVRITWRQLHRDEALLAADLRRLVSPSPRRSARRIAP